MKKLYFALCASVAVLAASAPAMAAVTIDAATGASGSFEWNDGLGAIDGIGGSGETIFSLTANAGDTVNVGLFDCCIPGDQFELVLNGSVVTPTSVGSPGGTFSYAYSNIVLAAGANIFAINVTALAPGYLDGGADYSFSAVTAGSGAVPEPATWAMMIGGFGMVGGALRGARRQSAKLASA